MNTGLFIGPDNAPDRYRLLRSIGRGGEAVLYLAELELSGATEPVVVKVLDARQTLSQELFSKISTKWREQAELLRFVHRLGVVGIREHFEGPSAHPGGKAEDSSGGGRALYLVMNHVEGLDLRDWRAERALDTPAQRREAVRCLEQLADVLDWLHSGTATPSGRTVVHGDLSPGNVMIDANGQATLVDFGLSKLTADHQTAEVWFTPGFAAPEVFEGKRSPATDRYAFGAIAYFLLSGVSPATMPEALRAALLDLPELVAVGPDKAARIASIFANDPAARPESLAAWVRDLRPAVISTTTRPPVLPPMPGRTPAARAGAAAGAVPPPPAHAPGVAPTTADPVVPPAPRTPPVPVHTPVPAQQPAPVGTPPPAYTPQAAPQAAPVPGPGAASGPGDGTASAASAAASGPDSGPRPAAPRDPRVPHQEPQHPAPAAPPAQASGQPGPSAQPPAHPATARPEPSTGPGAGQGSGPGSGAVSGPDSAGSVPGPDSGPPVTDTRPTVVLGAAARPDGPGRDAGGAGGGKAGGTGDSGAGGDGHDGGKGKGAAPAGRRSRKPQLVLASVIALVLIGGGAYAGVALSGNGKDDKASGSHTSAPDTTLSPPADTPTPTADPTTDDTSSLDPTADDGSADGSDGSTDGSDGASLDPATMSPGDTEALTTLSPADSDETFSKDNAKVNGKQYYDALVTDNWCNGGYSEYNLGRHWSKFSVTLGVDDDGKNLPVMFTVTADGNQQFHSQVVLGKPSVQSFDVSGALRLRIEWAVNDDGTGCGTGVLADPTLVH